MSLDRALLPEIVQDARGLAFLELIDRASAIDAEKALLYWLTHKPGSPSLVPAVALQEMGEQLHLGDSDGWPLARNDEERRALLSEAIRLHRHKGTPWALRRALELVGWPSLALQEGVSISVCNGAIGQSKGWVYRDGALDNTWAGFRLIQPAPRRPVELTDLNLIRQTVDAWKPARCIFDATVFTFAFTSKIAKELLSDISFFKVLETGFNSSVVGGSFKVTETTATSVKTEWEVDLWRQDTAGKILIPEGYYQTFALFNKTAKEIARVKHPYPLFKNRDTGLRGSWSLTT